MFRARLSGSTVFRVEGVVTSVVHEVEAETPARHLLSYATVRPTAFHCASDCACAVPAGPKVSAAAVHRRQAFLAEQQICQEAMSSLIT